MIPATYNLPDAYAGDTYGPLVFYFNDVSGNAIPLDGTIGSCQVKDKITKCTAINWNSNDSSISISGNQVVFNAVSGSLMDIPPQTYEYDFQINSSGLIRTYIRGDLTVVSQISS
jgi:hypothetical protein